MPAWLAPVLGGAIGGIASAWGQQSANRTNVRLAREQMAFQERMSSTAYQRATQDMRSAGINPMLAYMQGGASSPGGARADVANVAQAGVSSALQGAAVKAELKLLGEQAEAARSQGAKAQKEAEGQLLDNQWKRALLDAGVPQMEASSARAAASLANLRIPEQQALAEMWKALGGYGEGAKGAAGISKFIIPLLTSFIRRK